MHMQVHRTKAQTLKKKSERKKEKKIIREKTVQFDLLRSPSHAQSTLLNALLKHVYLKRLLVRLFIYLFIYFYYCNFTGF